jgi:hypothetical protein
MKAPQHGEAGFARVMAALAKGSSTTKSARNWGIRERRPGKADHVHGASHPGTWRAISAAAVDLVGARSRRQAGAE